jgi:hypothetical protein
MTNKSNQEKDMHFQFAIIIIADQGNHSAFSNVAWLVLATGCSMLTSDSSPNVN